MKRRKMMLMVGVERMMQIKYYCAFAFLPESLICDGATIEKAWA